VIVKAFSASDPNLEHEYSMLRRLHRHPKLFVQLHTAVVFGSARVGLEMEYISDAAVPFYPCSEAELQCYMRSLLQVHPFNSGGTKPHTTGAEYFACRAESHSWRHQARQCPLPESRREC